MNEFETFEEVLTELFQRGLISRCKCQYRKSLLRAGGGSMATAGLRHFYRIDDERERYVLTAAQQITAPDRLPHQRSDERNDSAAGGG